MHAAVTLGTMQERCGRYGNDAAVQMGWGRCVVVGLEVDGRVATSAF